jgi:putative GTP pyrophosphokinase
MAEVTKGEVQEPDSRLREKAIRFFHRHERVLDQIRDLLDIRLNQLALAYTTEHRVPVESITIKTRVKTLDSFLKKMSRLQMQDFRFPKDVLYDLIGARVTCWFLDDCKGIAQCILNSHFLSIKPEGVFNYIDSPKKSGYRGIHLHTEISYDSLSTEKGEVKIVPQKVVCEIQVRTKLMDTWADLTHEFHYKAKDMGIQDDHMEKVLETQAKRFYSEDESFIAIRNLYQKMISQSGGDGNS